MAERRTAHEQLLIKFEIDGYEAPIKPESGSLAIYESMAHLVPSASVKFTDYISALVSNYPLVPASEIGLTLQDNDDLKQMMFYPFTHSATQAGMQTDAFESHLHLISTHADPLLLHREHRSEFGKASEYVRGLASRLGLSAEVEETKDNRVWINPGWRAPQMLRYLAQHAVSSNGSSGYVYFVRYDGTLVFKSIDRLFAEAESPEKILVSIGGQDVQHYKLTRNLFSSVVFGTNYLTHSHYCMSSSSDVAMEVKADEFVGKYGEAAGFSTSFQKTGLGFYMQETFKDDYDRFPTPESVEVYRRASVQAGTSQVDIIVKPNPFGRKIGSVVDLVFPSDSADDVNLPFSGRYLVSSIVTLGGNEYYQRLRLVRPGINISQRENVT